MYTGRKNTQTKRENPSNCTCFVRVFTSTIRITACKFSMNMCMNNKRVYDLKLLDGRSMSTIFRVQRTENIFYFIPDANTQFKDFIWGSKKVKLNTIDTTYMHNFLHAYITRHTSELAMYNMVANLHVCRSASQRYPFNGDCLNNM